MCTNTCTYIHVVHVCTCSPFQTQPGTEQPQHNTYICIDCINRWRKTANHPKRCGGGDYKSQLQWSYFPLPLRPCWPNTNNDCVLCVHVPCIQGTAISICKPHTDIVAATETGMSLHTQSCYCWRHHSKGYNIHTVPTYCMRCVGHFNPKSEALS